MHQRNKGAVGEREVAALLQAWWRAIEPWVVFVRTPASGGWQHAKGFRARGDVMVGSDTDHPPASFPFTVEVKRRERWNVERFLAGKPSPVWAWWQQVVDAARDEGAVPMLWVRRNRGEWYVVIPRAFARVPPDHEWPFVQAETNGPVVAYLATTLLTSDPGRWRDRRVRPAPAPPEAPADPPSAQPPRKPRRTRPNPR